MNHLPARRSIIAPGELTIRSKFSLNSANSVKRTDPARLGNPGRTLL
jgi:hypothetical protein